MKKPLLIRRVSGHSMTPTLNEGQIILASGWLKPKVNDIVIVKASDQEHIKRIIAINGTSLQLGGDHPAHRQYGTVNLQDVVARVLELGYAKPGNQR